MPLMTTKGATFALCSRYGDLNIPYRMPLKIYAKYSYLFAEKLALLAQEANEFPPQGLDRL